MRSKYGYEPPLSLNFSLSDTHANVQVLAAADTDSGTEIVSLWLEFGTTVSLIRVEGDHMAECLAGVRLAERPGSGKTH